MIKRYMKTSNHRFFVILKQRLQIQNYFHWKTLNVSTTTTFLSCVLHYFSPFKLRVYPKSKCKNFNSFNYVTTRFFEEIIVPMISRSVLCVSCVANLLLEIFLGIHVQVQVPGREQIDTAHGVCCRRVRNKSVETRGKKTQFANPSSKYCLCNIFII